MRPSVLYSVAPASRRALLGAPLLALTAFLAACGGSSTASSPTTVAGPASASAYTQCLTSHGVPASAAGPFGGRRPNGSAPGTSVPGAAPAGTRPTVPAQYQAAFQACQSLRPARGGFGAAALNNAAYRNCLQLHGVTLPAPPTTTPGQPPPTRGPGAGFGSQANTPAFQQARQACANLLPARGGTTTTTLSPQS